MNDFAVYFMLHSIEKVRGGMTRAVIRRANMLSRIYQEIGLITFDFNPDYENVIQHYKDIGLWSDEIKHYNVYDYFMNQQGNPKHNTNPRNTGEASIQNYEGRNREVTHYDKKTGKPTKKLLFTKEGCCFFVKNDEPASYLWLDWNGEIIQSFKRVRDYRHHFIQSLIGDKDVVLVSDSRFTDRILFGTKYQNTARIAVLHSNHLQSPYEYGSLLVKRNELLFHQLNGLDAIVTLTESQAKDIGSRFGKRSTIHTVGHPLPESVEGGKVHDPYLAVMLARYAGIKQIPHAIKAFKKVIKRVPEAKLEIWGFGREELKYNRLIKKAKLQNHVFIKGFTNQVEDVYRRASFSMITSKSEAFGMSIIESMSVGTPVICYACKYGPTDIITHNKDGLLVDPGDINGLADAMVSLFLNKEKRHALSMEAIKITEKFGEKKLAYKWKAIFEEARKQQRQRIHIEGIDAEFVYVGFNHKNGIEVEGRICMKELHPSFKQKMSVFLLLRRRKDMEDLYAPLEVTWVTPDTLLFKGAITNLYNLHKGCWDLILSVSCLNFHQFVKPNFIGGVAEAGNANLTICKDGELVYVKVYRPRKKKPFNTYYIIEKCKSLIRDKLRKRHPA